MEPNGPRHPRTLFTLISPLAVFAACSGGSSQATPRDSGAKDAGPACKSFTTTSKESDISAAISATRDGDCITFAAGTYKLNNQLAFGSGHHVKMSGAGMGKTIFDFSGEVSGDDGIFAQSIADLTLEEFSVQNTPGNGVKVLGVAGVTFDSVEVSWTGSAKSQHGAYGLYPVQSKDVLIQGSRVSGASDTGIYVGQSQAIVVRDNEVFGNVAGIEIENSYSADVYRNRAHDNAAGILVFSLPGLPQRGGHSIRVFQNTIADNNDPNFAAKGDIVSILPSGTGSLVMACDHVEFFGNTYAGNKTGALAIISYLDAQLPITDPTYYPYSSFVSLHDDTFVGENGMLPDFRSQFGLLLLSAIGSFPGMRISDVFYDGVVDPKKPAAPDPMHICIKEPKADAVCDLNLDQFDSQNPNLPSILSCHPPSSSPFDCSLPALPAVSFPGLAP